MSPVMDTSSPAAPSAAARLRPWLERIAAARRWDWVPICPLGEVHRARIERHLLALGERDRYLRFGYPASDERIRQHVARLDFTQHELFGIFDRRLRLVALAHLAHADPQRRMCEFAVSVLPGTRGRGYGRRLFAHAMRHCRNRRVDQLFIHALTENTAMLRIARGAGARLQHEGGESEAWLQLPPDDVGSHVSELLDTRASLLDYLLKRQGRQIGWTLRLLAALKGRLGQRRGIASH